LKASVYIETSIVSYLASRPSRDIRVAANQHTTASWWETGSARFDLYVSEIVLAEAARGDAAAAQRRLSIIRHLPELEVNQEVELLAKALVDEGPIPQKAILDGFHIAVAAVHGIQYLLTWNCTHIANAVMRTRIEWTCRRYSYEPPIICTPLELSLE
jgi:predicted nucleic acid-binding protein